MSQPPAPADEASAAPGRRPRTGAPLDRLLTFLRQVVAELRKVVWPTQQQLITYLIVVLVFVMVLIAYVSVLDLAFGDAIFRIFGGDGKGGGGK